MIALVLANGEIHTIDDTIEGLISAQPKGDHGFGYDPIFFIPELGKTMAELPAEEKNRISHRGKAAARAKALLQAQLDQMPSD